MKAATYPTPRVVEWQNAIKAAELAVDRAIAMTLATEPGRTVLRKKLDAARSDIREAHRWALENTK